MAILPDAIIHNALAHQALDYRDVESARWLLSAAANPAYLAVGEAEE